MQDRVPLYPGRVTLTPVSGQANTFDLTRADQPTQEGTPLNKASLLKDATAALYGLPNTAVPDNVLSKIKTLIDSANANANTKARIATGSYTGTGTYGASNPNSLTFEFAPKIVLLTIANTGKSGNNPYAYPMLFGSNVGAKDGFTSYIMHTDMLSTTYKNGLGFAGIGSSNYSYTYGKKSSDGKTFSWYNTTDDSAQCNRPASSGLVYHYFAIG